MGDPVVTTPRPGAARDVIHGHAVDDPYRWLEDADAPPVREWLDTQSALFEAHAARWPVRAALRGHIARLLDHDVWSPPRRRGPHVFAGRRTPRSEHPQLLVIPAETADGTAAGERVLVDVLALDPTGGTVLDKWEPSPDGRLVAVQTANGAERGSLAILDAATGEIVDGPITGVRHSPVAWLPGGDAFYYARGPGGGTGNGRRRGIWLHRVGSAASDDALIHPPARDHATVPNVRVEHGRWLVVSESFGTGYRNDLWLADLTAGAPDRPALREIHRGQEIETEARIGPDGRLYLRTTWQASRRRICWADPRDPRPERWCELIGEDPAAALDGFAPLAADGTGGAGGTEILVIRTRDGISELAAHDARTGRLLHPIGLPGDGRINARTAEFATHSAHLVHAGVAQPPLVVEYRPGWHRTRVWRRSPSTGEPAAGVRRYRATVTSADGAAVPVTVLSTRPLGAPGPTILHGYGGFGRSRQFGFSASLLAWLQMGGQYVVAHVRGGGEAGRDWHMQGARAGKNNAIEDLIAVGRWLADRGYTTPAQLCLSGASAGGLLVLAAAVRRPDLCNAVIASVPLADMVRFERLGLGALWTAEFGTVADPAEFRALLSYSPYHGVRAGERYPAFLITGFHDDTRTDAAHARKMCAALQQATSSDRPVLLRYEYDAGHSRQPMSRAIELAVDAHAFAAAWTGLTAPRAAATGPRPGAPPRDQEGR
jgi:prolyl oligopeptidase